MSNDEARSAKQKQHTSERNNDRRTPCEVSGSRFVWCHCLSLSDRSSRRPFLRKERPAKTAPTTDMPLALLREFPKVSGVLDVSAESVDLLAEHSRGQPTIIKHSM